ncbi:NUDIX hydrolase [Thermodesulfobacteriota bacterium]
MRKKTNCCYCGGPLIDKMCEGSRRLFCEHCREPIYENPVPATSLVVVDDKNHLLLVERNVEPKIGYWCLPGGFIELGETPETSALRELAEETGLSGNINRLLGVASNHSDRYHTVLLAGYLVTRYSGELSAGDDAAQVAFFRPDELPEIAFESHLYFIRTYYGDDSIGG